MRNNILPAIVMIACSVYAGRESVDVWPDGGSQPTGSGPAWEAFADYRLRGAETWDQAAERATTFESDREAVEFIAEAFAEHRVKAFAERLGPIEQERMYVGDEWQPDEAAKLWSEFASQARGE